MSDNLQSLIQEILDDVPTSECAEEGISCALCHAPWNQARAQFGDGEGFEHHKDCWIIRASAALAAAIDALVQQQQQEQQHDNRG